MYRAGMGEQASFDYVLTSDYAVLLAEEFGRKPIVNDEAAFDLYPPPPHPNPETLPTRPPVVTIMGHVDHGKTTLLDTLRSSSVAKGEVGGITQHIGAFSVPVPASAAGGPESITFLDTPGHAAFSAMRARGAHVTDIIVLVVAADDGIMPQTREVIELIKKDRDKVGVVVAINKIDKPGRDVDAVHRGLLVEDIHLEELGGDVPSVEVSGLTGKGLPDLVETLSLISEIQDLRADPDGAVFGYVLESKVVKGLGPIATVLVLRGSLKPGSHILSGVHHAKVRIMHDSNGNLVKTASPGMAITVSGWKSIPEAGDEVLQGSESDIKRAIVNRQRKADIQASLEDVEAINSSRQQERDKRQAEAEAAAAAEQGVAAVPKTEEPTGPKELRLIIKADVSGSAEAVEGALQGIGNHLAVTKIITSSVGPILESDVMKAKTIGGAVVGFSVSCSRAIETLAAQNNVPILMSDVIYRLMEQVKERVIGLLPVILEFRVLGEAKVLQLFEIQMKGKVQKTVAGSRVINGLVEKNKQARVLRDGNIIFEGKFETMRHFKKEVTELRKGTECGLNLAGFDDLKVDDVIQTFETIEKPGIL
ncbi:P-loop containing nucleoside triphosphate hydrolase protein [Mycena filopes]|nr:P-loop containing nucleoside triphosphate hydrolase protein [Mycena filopes]